MKLSSTVAGLGSALLIFSVAAPGVSYAADGPSGDWVVVSHAAIVRIEKCAGGFCGFVAKGRPGKDYRNPDPKKRGRSLIGSEVLINMKPSGAGSWSGTTYNAEDGQIYAGKITLVGANTLKTEFCAPGGRVCGSETWTRGQ